MTDTLDLQSLRQAADSGVNIEALMDKVQEFASSWSLLGSGSAFEADNQLELTEESRAELRTMLTALLDRLERAEAPVTDEREAFEAWFAANKFGGMRESMWAAWEARASRSPAGAAVPEGARKVIEEAAQVLESAASYNRTMSRTVIAHTQQDRADRLRAILASPAAPSAPTEQPELPVELVGVKQQLDENAGFWHSCSGCYDTEDGHPTGTYSYSNELRCALGSGCSECGGLGAVWDNIDYSKFGEDAAEPAPVAQASQQPVAWAAFAENGNIRIWTSAPDDVRKLAEAVGMELTPLYLAAPLQQAEGWISVDDERKPEVCKPILVAVQCQSYSERDNGEYEQVTFTEVTEGEYSKYSDDIERRFEPFQGQMADRQYVSHWMPLPTPPLPAQSQPAGPAKGGDANDETDRPTPSPQALSHDTEEPKA